MRVPRHEKCTVQKHTLCRDESRDMVPAWAPCAAGTHRCRQCTDSAPRSHATVTMSGYTHRDCGFEQFMNSHQDCLGAYLVGNARSRKPTKGGDHGQDQCRRNAGDGAFCTALVTRQSSSPSSPPWPLLAFEQFLPSVAASPPDSSPVLLL